MAPTTASSSATPAGQGEGVVQFLNSILSQRGPNALPYAEDVKWTVRQHLLDLLQDFPSLALKHGEYTHNDGRGVHLLRAEGTVPMYYQNVKYNIPITMWLTEGYPRSPPTCYVVPTPDMVIKPRHQYVDSSGVVSTPYLHNWGYPASNLIDLVHTLSILFGQDPPLFSKPPNWVPPPPTGAGYQQQHLGQGVGGGGGGAAHMASPTTRPVQELPRVQPVQPGSAQPPIPAVHHPPPPAARPVQPPPAAAARPAHQAPAPASSSAASPAEEFRRIATRAITQRLRAQLKRDNQAAVAGMEGLFEQQGELMARAQALASGVEALEAEKAALEAQIRGTVEKCSELDIWLLQHDSAGEGDVDVDRAIAALDAPSRQALEAQAEDLAIEDALYELDRAVKGSAIDPEPYLKQVRALCRRQFFCRATALKVAAVRGAAAGGGGHGGGGAGGAEDSRAALLSAAAGRGGAY